MLVLSQRTHRSPKSSGLAAAPLSLHREAQPASGTSRQPAAGASSRPHCQIPASRRNFNKQQTLKNAAQDVRAV